MTSNFLLHFRPKRIAKDALRFTLTWGLGGLAALMILQQLFSGILLGFFYEPLPVQAYESVQHIQNKVFMGQLLRNLHHWTGHALVIVIFLHMLRIFVSTAFYPPRHWNWLMGLGLGLLVLIANFSGYLLPWDQLSYWAVTIAISMLGYIPVFGTSLQEIVWGGGELGAATLQLFYSIHTTLIPLALVCFMVYHFWLVRKAGGVLLSRTEKEKTADTNKREYVSFAPELLVRETAFAAIVSCALLLFSMFVNAPLGNMANPALTPASVKAPWYFLGAQELLLHIPAVFAVFVIPLMLIIFLGLIPFVAHKNGEPSPLVKFLFYGTIALLVGLTIIGVWFRGPGMQLVWPW